MAQAHPLGRLLATADPEETPVTVSHAQFIARVTQAASFFHELGVSPNDVVSLLMPLLPQTFFALFVAQADSVANPVNPLLSATQITEILRAANTKVRVALGLVLRWDSTQRAVSRMLADLPPAGATVKVEVGPHAVHCGSITVRIGGVTETERASLAQQVHARLDPLVTQHQIVWV